MVNLHRQAFSFIRFAAFTQTKPYIHSENLCLQFAPANCITLYIRIPLIQNSADLKIELMNSHLIQNKNKTGCRKL